MQTRNDLDEYRPVLRTLGAFLIYVLRGMTTVDAYSTVDAFLDRLEQDIDARLQS